MGDRILDFWNLLVRGYTSASPLKLHPIHIEDLITQANLMAASAILAGLRLENDVIQRLVQRDIMQESVIYRSIQKEKAQEIALNLLRECVSVEIVARGTGLSIDEVQQLQQQLNEPTQG